MKVAIVCPYDLGAHGGVQDQARKLTAWLQEAGHDAWLVGPGTKGPPGVRLVGPVTVIRANGAATPLALSPSAWGRTAEAIVDADLVHVHEPFMPLVSQAAVAQARAPVVGTFHADPSRTVRRLYRVAGSVLRRVADRLAVSTAVSPVAAGALDGIFSTRIVPNGIDVASFRPVTKNPNQVAFLGRDDLRKGLGVLLEAWPQVTASVPAARLIVAGVGQDRGTHAGVTFAGAVGRDRKRRILGESAVFCAPNTGGESFGLVVAEAMAAECAVVASAIAAFVNVVGDAASLTKPGDSEALAAAIVNLLAHPAERERMAAQGLARVGRFDRAVVLAGYLEAYEAALTGG